MSSCRNESSGTEIIVVCFLLFFFLASGGIILWGLALVAGQPPYSSGVYCFPLSNILKQGIQKDIKVFPGLLAFCIHH